MSSLSTLSSHSTPKPPCPPLYLDSSNYPSARLLPASVLMCALVHTLWPFSTGHRLWDGCELCSLLTAKYLLTSTYVRHCTAYLTSMPEIIGRALPTLLSILYWTTSIMILEGCMGLRSSAYVADGEFGHSFTIIAFVIWFIVHLGADWVWQRLLHWMGFACNPLRY